jgi:hypothetical protein
LLPSALTLASPFHKKTPFVGAKVVSDIVDHRESKSAEHLKRPFIRRRHRRPDCTDADADQLVEHVTANRGTHALTLELWEYCYVEKPPGTLILIQRDSADRESHDCWRNLRYNKRLPAYIQKLPQRNAVKRVRFTVARLFNPAYLREIRRTAATNG